MPQPLTLGTYKMQTGFTARFALWAAVGAAIGGLAPSASAQVITYNRNAAVNYANANWNKVVSDGYFWINGSTATYYGAGAAVPVNVANEAGGIGDDCAHFVSSAIGSPAGATAGGLTIPSRAGTYGEPGAARLNELLVGSSLGGYGTTYKYGTVVSSISQLTPGDVIGYDWDGSGGGSMSGIDHTTIYLGNGQIAAHATSHDGVAWNWNNSSSTITFLIHIALPDNIVPTAPRNSSPAANTIVSNLTPILTANAFSDGAIGSTQTASEWEIFKGGTLVYNTGTDTTDLLGLTVPAGILAAGNSYAWQVRYEDNYGDWSSYSPTTSFSTTPVPEPSCGLLATCALLLLIRRRRPTASV
jgi:cell wall-associated NlpC family hydrolase